MKNVFLFFSILFSLSGFAQTKLLSDTSLPKRIINISDLNSTKNKLSHLDSMAVYGEASKYASYSHYLRQIKKDENLKANFSITANRKVKILSKQDLLKLPRIDSNFSIPRYSPYDNGKLKIKVSIQCDSLHKLILKKYGYFTFTIINPNTDDEIEKIKIDSSFIFTVYKPFDKYVIVSIELKGIYSPNTKNYITIIDNNIKEIILPYHIDCNDNSYLINNACPQCLKLENVIMQTFGYPEFDENDIEKSDGNFVVLKNGKEIFLGGCKIYNCMDIWYCKRCKLEF